MENPYLWFAIFTTPTAGGVMLAIFLKYRRGLATRLFFTVVPLVLATGWLGFYAGVEQSKTAMAIACGIAVMVVVPTLLVLVRSFVANMATHIEGLLTSSLKISATARQAATSASEQAATVSQVNSAVDEISKTSSLAASSAAEVMQSAAQATAKGERSVAAVKETKRLLELIGQVGEILDSVNDLADQSNVLAVNAGIEATKAGEHGRGFGVVAAEVRTLAEQSKRATQRIRPIIARAGEGRHTVETTGTLLAEIARVLEDNASRARNIAETAAQQASGIQQIAAAMNSVAESGRNNAVAARQLEEAVGHLNQISERLRQFVHG